MTEAFRRKSARMTRVHPESMSLTMRAGFRYPEPHRPSYTPTLADVGRCLRATAVYTDNIGNANDEAMGVLEVPARVGHASDTDQQRDSGFVNAAPVFPDQDFQDRGGPVGHLQPGLWPRTRRPGGASEKLSAPSTMTMTC